MRDICLDEGILQSYLDGELSLEMAEQVAGHVAACEPCALMLREAEGELAVFSAAFAAEDSWAVPSEQLRVRINRAIDELHLPDISQDCERQSSQGLRGWLSSLAGALAFRPQRAAAFASLVALVGFGLVFAALYRQNPAPTPPGGGQQVAINQAPGPVESHQGGAATPTPNKEASVGVQTPTIAYNASPVKMKSQRRRALSNRAEQDPPSGGQTSQSDQLAANRNSTEPKNILTPGAQPALAELPGEKNYLKTIASLATAIDAGGSTLTMKPTLRAEYERNLALVNQAISATRPVALSKPGDPAAAQFLYSAYQSKIDLLSAVADQQSEAIARR